MTNSVTFALLEPTARVDPADVLGLWRMPAPSPDVAFSAPGPDAGTHDDDPPVWRIELPADRSRAWLSLDSARDRAASAQARLPRTADTLLDVVAGRVGSDPGSDLPAAELELSRWLEERRDPGPGVAFGVSDQLASWTREAADALGDLNARIARWCAPTARVDTHLGDRLVGRSAVRWRGDAHSAVRAELGAEDVRLHASAVGLVRSSRATLLSALGIALEGALLVARLVALPGGPLLALPATFRFVNRLLAEAQR